MTAPNQEHFHTFVYIKYRLWHYKVKAEWLWGVGLWAGNQRMKRAESRLISSYDVEEFYQDKLIWSATICNYLQLDKAF